MSKDLFFQMREQEVITDKFLPTKAQLKTSSTQFAKDIIEAGEIDKHEAYTQIVRLKESVNAIEAELKNAIGQEDFEAFGVRGEYVAGGDLPQYTDDPIYADLKNQVKQREDLLKVALKSDAEIYDETGVLVPKVSVKPKKSSLRITF